MEKVPARTFLYDEYLHAKMLAPLPIQDHNSNMKADAKKGEKNITLSLSGRFCSILFNSHFVFPFNFFHFSVSQDGDLV